MEREMWVISAERAAMQIIKATGRSPYLVATELLHICVDFRFNSNWDVIKAKPETWLDASAKNIAVVKRVARFECPY